jgi:hypothetical protein
MNDVVGENMGQWAIIGPTMIQLEVMESAERLLKLPLFHSGKQQE